MTKTNKNKFTRKGTIEDKVFIAICYSFAAFCVAIVLYPLIYIYSASFSSAKAVLSGQVWLWPVDISFVGYKYILNYKYIWIGYRNTIFYSFFGTGIAIFMTLICAYPLARQNLRGRRIITFLFSFTMIFSGGMIPSYILMRNLNLINTVWAILIPSALSVYTMIVAKTFLQTNIPDELMEAAKIDGHSDIGIFLKIVLPLSKAIIAVMALMYVSGHWNSYFNAFLYLNSRELYPLQMFLRQILINSDFDTDLLDPEALAHLQTLQQTLKYSLIVVAMTPMLMAYPFVQKYFEKGVMIGSLKE